MIKEALELYSKTLKKNSKWYSQDLKDFELFFKKKDKIKQLEIINNLKASFQDIETEIDFWDF